MGGKQSRDRKVDRRSRKKDENKEELKSDGVENKPSFFLESLPDTSDPSKLLLEKTRNVLYASLPVRVRGCKWFLLYSTSKHGISLGTLYRRSTIWPGPSLLVVGDSKGVIFGGLVEAPLKQNDRKYQGTNQSFVFTTKTGQPVVYRATGTNRYYTLCSNDSLSVGGGGGSFALYLDSDLLSGSSKVSLTYGNPCLAETENFEVKEVELWGFVYASKYDEVLAQSQKQEFGVCRW